MKKAHKIHIGTSGWHYGHWKGPFYPHSIKAKDFLGYYAEHFHTVEINNSFYQMPEKRTLIDWCNSVPDKFIFSIKASRYITHMKKLKDSKKPLLSFLKKANLLKDKLGPILFQLPPRWRLNPERLNSFLKILSEDYRYTFEFRDPSWFSPEVYDMLADNGVAFCIYDFDRLLSPKTITGDFVYVRLHGHDGPYRGQYKTKILAGWAGAFSTWASQKKEVHCYFDNDEAGYAAQDALRLQAMINK